MKPTPILLLLALLAGCATPPPPAEQTAKPVSSAESAITPTAPNAAETPSATPPAVTEPTTPATPAPMPWLKAAEFKSLPGWAEDDLTQAWPALLQSCKGLKRQPAWARTCQAAEQVSRSDAEGIRRFFESHFRPYQVEQAESGDEGLITGYYEPLLRGSRSFGGNYIYPLYAAPDDLLIVDLASLYPELKNLRLRGRLQGKRVVPYFSRAEIEAGNAPVRGKELVWVDDPIELFFLQIQGSGRVQLENGEMMRVGYADQNGHPYKSIGKWLVDQGELTLDKASMQGIKDWARKNPEKLATLLNTNPSYVFFRELPNHLSGPLGALGVPLTAERSVAIDPRAIPLGAPIWLATTRPNSPEPLNRLMLAQDTGGAIRGNVRADFFWGFGEVAGQQAGAMKQKGRTWVFLPRDYPLVLTGTNGKSGL
ncbi:membrane-bound lytic murein transglycosylase A [Sulfuritortus calidifontis]|uniref:peptidoglycan lytic exotransglycosylase n=1 Tax=Sulfuritortus calidifontis TaxID=1914471 RepID=A0A4R3JWK0_9PROT|nr:murein transglycosylase A [Sulfuritortus calidifontis]TCS72630.1 membrane-bound lytic murein transglycosylase A [Sulfuritortus calidifontis]